MDHGQNVAGLDRVADLLFEHDAHGQIDGRVFAIATRPQGFAGKGDLERVGPGDITIGLGRHWLLRRRRRQKPRIVHHAWVTVLRPDEFRKFA